MEDAVREQKPGVVERAFQVAKSGAVATIADLYAQLAAEGYGNCQQVLSGRSLSLQIKRMITEAQMRPPTGSTTG